MKTSLATLERVRENLIAQKGVVEGVISNYGTSKEKNILKDYTIYKIFELHGIHCYTNMMDSGKFDRNVEGKKVPRMRICPEIHNKNLLSTDLEGRLQICEDNCAFYHLCIDENKKYTKILRVLRDSIIQKKIPSINKWNDALNWLVYFIEFIDKRIGELQ